jgi:hypothetical protein
MIDELLYLKMEEADTASEVSQAFYVGCYTLRL